jgi:hypothetical protein
MKKLFLQLFFSRSLGPFILSVYLPSAMFVMMSWVSFFVPPVSGIKSGSVQSVCVLFLRLFVMMSWVSFFVPPEGEIKSGSVPSVCALFLRLVSDDELGLLLRAPGS